MERGRMIRVDASRRVQEMEEKTHRSCTTFVSLSEGESVFSCWDVEETIAIGPASDSILSVASSVLWGWIRSQLWTSGTSSEDSIDVDVTTNVSSLNICE